MSHWGSFSHIFTLVLIIFNLTLNVIIFRRCFVMLSLVSSVPCHIYLVPFRLPYMLLDID